MSVMEAAAQLRADVSFMGVTGVHPGAGLSTGNAEEAAVKRCLRQRAAGTVVQASTEKLLAASAFVAVKALQCSGVGVQQLPKS